MRQLGRRTTDLRRLSSSAPKPSFYLDKPSGSLTLADAETLGSARLELLRMIDEYQTKSAVSGNDSVKSFEERQAFENRVLEFLRKNLRTANDDTVSHFLLRMAFCQTEELRRWFLKTEDALFRIRFSAFQGDAMTRTDDHFLEMRLFMSDNDIESIEQFQVDQLDPRVQNQLRQPFFGMSLIQPHTIYYRVPWTQVLRLISTQRCVIEEGYAFIASESLAELLASKFRSQLADELNVIFTAIAAKSSNRTAHDRRLAPILTQLARQHVAAAQLYTPKLGDVAAQVTRDQIPAVG